MVNVLSLSWNWRCWTLICLAITAGVIWVCGWENVRSIERSKTYLATLIVGHASVMYQYCQGRPPDSVGDLIAEGYICKTPQGRAQLNIVNIDEHRFTEDWKHIERITLAFPEKPDGCNLVAGLVVHNETREGVCCMRSRGDCGPLDAELVRRFDLYWYRVARGEPTGEAWFDEAAAARCPRDAAGAATQPIEP